MRFRKHTVRALAFIAMAIIGAAFLTAEIRATNVQAHEAVQPVAAVQFQALGSQSGEVFLSYFRTLLRFAFL